MGLARQLTCQMVNNELYRIETRLHEDRLVASLLLGD